ncbi:hypothetical protein HDN1F_03430 [gamma proteobacterium HdN1]|nr:hypothetical protein HDN1F_03430 [gamma proteobacterium HdN1]
MGEQIRVNAAGTTRVDAEKEAANKKQTDVPLATTEGSAPPPNPQAKMQAELLKKSCELYSTNLKVMKERGQIRETTTDGKARMLTDEEKQSRIQEAEKYLEEKCQGVGN